MMSADSLPPSERYCCMRLHPLPLQVAGSISSLKPRMLVEVNGGDTNWAEESRARTVDLISRHIVRSSSGFPLYSLRTSGSFQHSQYLMCQPFALACL